MIRTLIVDDQTLVREGIKILLEKATEIDIIDEAEDGNTALEKIAKLQPDIVLLDIVMPGIDGLALADQIRTQFPQVKIVMLSSHDNPEYVRRSTQLGAKGYLLKKASSQELEWSIKLVYQGYSTIKSELLDKQLLNNNLSLETAPVGASLMNFPPVANDVSLPNSVGDNQQLPTNLYSDAAIGVTSVTEQANLDKIEFLLAKKSVQQKYSSYRQQRRRNPLFHFHDVRISQVKKTMMSFEFRLLVAIIMFCLGLLVFIALS
ncbi:two component transcriptional regulator, LuxR family protein [Chondrocystis sp. NIES-4102]|nr:two component transcriptional regulator, LuxR family protein [Chondrocystis sp. NIES-4102]